MRHPSSVAKHRPVRPQVAGVAAESSAGNKTELFQPEGLRQHGYQAIQLEPGGVRMGFKLGPQKQFAAEPGQVRGRHLEVFGVGPHPVAQSAVHFGKAFGTPGAKQAGGLRQHHGWKNAGLSAVTLGLARLAKSTCVFLYPIYLLTVIVRYWKSVADAALSKTW